MGDERGSMDVWRQLFSCPEMKTQFRSGRGQDIHFACVGALPTATGQVLHRRLATQSER